MIPVIYEDDWVLVVDKPSGLPTHAAQGVTGPDLLTEVRAHTPSAALLHRLDREASGLLVLGKQREANVALQQQLEAHAVDRRYVAWVRGHFVGERVVDRPVPERAQGRAAVRGRPPPGALPARSRFVARTTGPRASLVEVALATGRKHQIRVHAASIGHPILGDRRYGGPPAARLMLHAYRLTFSHPRDGRPMVLEAPLPPELDQPSLGGI